METVSATDLAVAQDPARMQGVLQAALRPTTGAALDVRSCRIDYIRATPGRCVLQYQVELHEPVSGAVSTQAVTGVLYGAERTQTVWTELVESDPAAQRPVGAYALPPAIYVPAHHLILQVVPYDNRLPGLRRAVEGAPAIAAAMLHDGAAERADWQIAGWTNEILRYRPDMRAMVRLDLLCRNVSSGETAARRAYAKVYREREEGERAARLMQALWDRANTPDSSFAVARPIAYVAEAQTLLLAEVPGTRLLNLMRRAAAAEAEAAMRRAARAVAALHLLTFPEGMLAPADRDKQTRLVRVAEDLAAHDREHAPAIVEIVSAATAGFATAPLAPTHFDLKQGHIFIAGDRVTLLDFDKMALGDPLWDVANLVATLDQEREGNARRVQRRTSLADAFLEEYFARVPAAWQPLFPARYALAALADAAMTGRGQRGRPGGNGRQRRVAASLIRAQEALAGHWW